MAHYRHVVDATLDRLSLQNLEQKPIESFNKYAQRWWETIMLFMNTLRAPYLKMLVGGITSFDNLVIAGKMIENAMESRRIEVERQRKASR